MSAINTALGFLSSIAAVAYPPAVPFLAFAQRFEPVAEAAFPVIQDAIAGGPAAFEAFKVKAPDLYAHFADLAGALMPVDGYFPPSDHEVAALAAHVIGIDPPGWVHEETQRWWDRDKASMG